VLFGAKQPSASTSNRERFLEAVLASATDYAIITLDSDGHVTSWNEGARRLLGWTEAEIIGRPASVLFTETDCQDGAPQREMLPALDQGRAIDERWHLRKGGSVFWANGEMMPLHDPDGAHLGFVKILRDDTEQKVAAEKSRADAAFLQGVLASSADCIKILDLNARLVFMSEGGQQVMGVSDFNAVAGCPWPDFWRQAGNAAAKTAIGTAKAGGVGRFHGLAETFAGSSKWWDVQVTPILGADGRPERLLAVSRDITETKRAEEQAWLLSDELQHRVKNTMAMVQAIVRQTLRRASTPQAAQETIEQRLAAMDRAHTLLMRDSWTTSDLRSVVDSSLNLHDDGAAGRFRINGQEARLNAQAAMSLTLLLHELATTATKYGALSTQEGWVEIDWTAEREPSQDPEALRLHLTWRELGGPSVISPAQQGFGSRLIERGLASALEGKAVISFLNEGVSCHVTALIKGSPD